MYSVCVCVCVLLVHASVLVCACVADDAAPCTHQRNSADSASWEMLDAASAQTMPSVNMPSLRITPSADEQRAVVEAPAVRQRKTSGLRLLLPGGHRRHAGSHSSPDTPKSPTRTARALSQAAAGMLSPLGMRAAHNTQSSPTGQ